MALKDALRHPVDILKAKIHSGTPSETGTPAKEHVDDVKSPVVGSSPPSRRASLDIRPASRRQSLDTTASSPIAKLRSSFTSPKVSRSSSPSGIDHSTHHTESPLRRGSKDLKDGTRTPGHVDSLIDRAKSLTAGGPGRSLANPTMHSGQHHAGTGPSKHSQKVKRRKARKEQHRKEVEERRVRGEQEGTSASKITRKAASGSKYRNDTFGFLPTMNSNPDEVESFDFTDMSNISDSDVGKRVTLRARIDHVRPHSSKLAFVVLRYQMATLSAVISVDAKSRTSSRIHSRSTSFSVTPPGRLNSATNDQSVPRPNPVYVDAQSMFQTPSEESDGIMTKELIPSGTVTANVTPPSGIPLAAPLRNGSVHFETLDSSTTRRASDTAPSSILVSQDYAGAHAGLRREAEKPLPRHSTDSERPFFGTDGRGLDGSDSDSSSSESEFYDSDYDQEHEDDTVTEEFVQWIEHIRKESLVNVTGTLQRPHNSSGRIKEASAGLEQLELKIEKCFVVGRVYSHTPFQFGAIEGHKVATEEEKKKGLPESALEVTAKVNMRQELQNRTFDLRAPSNQAIFRIRASVCKIFREYLDERGFVEIQSAKIQGAATEGGAEVFKLDYFGRPAFLAQSPQLAKQQAIIADLGRVYEIGSIFRAEDSNTKRHLCEFFGMDLEMAIDTHYHECMHMIDGVLKAIFKGVQERNRKEIEVVKQRFPHEDLVIPDETVILHYREGVRLLNEAGHKHEDGSEIKEDEDFDTATEKRLGAIVKEKYNTDYYILDKFPVGVRPFYTMPDPLDSRSSNSFDIFLRGQEILSGGQRVHDAHILEAKMKNVGMDPKSLGEYTEAFQLGAPPHAGGGIGLERIIMLMLQLENIRYASMFPRDPKSFPDSGKPPPAPRPKIGRHGTLQCLEDLIAAYGDSTNTSWLDDRYTVWRHLPTGAAIGYVPAKHNYGIIWGSPLCAPEDMEQVLHGWLEHCDEIKLKPIWCCATEHVAEILNKRYRWKALSCVAESRVDPNKYMGSDESNIAKKIQQAKKAGLKVTILDKEPSQELKEELDKRIEEWSNKREGTQMHISDVSGAALVKDAKHKRFFIARDKDGKLDGVVVLARLSPEHGEQIKWSLQFPGAVSGTSEYLLSETMKAASSSGTHTLTFGASAASKIIPLSHESGLSLKVLSKAYESIVNSGNLLNKSDYRKKFNLKEEPLYICYPKHGLGTRGISAVMETVSDDTENKSRDAARSKTT